MILHDRKSIFCDVLEIKLKTLWMVTIYDEANDQMNNEARVGHVIPKCVRSSVSLLRIQ